VKLVFLGTPGVATVSLAALLDAGHRVELVVTQPDRPVGRSRTPSAPPVKRVALERGLEVTQPSRVRTRSFRERIAAVGADALVVVAYGRILSARALAIAPHGAINVHFSLLPAYRGAAPVQWALARGERSTGVTTMAMNERMDEGDLLLQRETVIGAGERAPQLAGRLARIGADLLLETLAGLASGTVRRRPQDPDGASYAPLLRPRDGDADPAWSAETLEQRTRGFDPWPGVWLRRAGRRIKLVDVLATAAPPDTAAPAPGTVVDGGPDGPVMVCGAGTRLVLRRVQLEGARPVDGRDALNGRQLAIGDRLEPGAPH
jgi:methionyl-tRNA formyltransferase